MIQNDELWKLQLPHLMENEGADYFEYFYDFGTVMESLNRHWIAVKLRPRAYKYI